MELRKYIEMGEKVAGGQAKLAEYLGQYDSNIRSMKRGKKGLPNPLCIKLADLIGEPRLEVIAASDLVTEKNEERRQLLESCFSKAAGIILAVGAFSIATPSPAEAVQIGDVAKNQLEEKTNSVYYVK